MHWSNYLYCQSRIMKMIDIKRRRCGQGRRLRCDPLSINRSNDLWLGKWPWPMWSYWIKLIWFLMLKNRNSSIWYGNRFQHRYLDYSASSVPPSSINVTAQIHETIRSKYAFVPFSAVRSPRLEPLLELISRQYLIVMRTIISPHRFTYLKMLQNICPMSFPTVIK